MKGRWPYWMCIRTSWGYCPRKSTAWSLTDLCLSQNRLEQLPDGIGGCVCVYGREGWGGGGGRRVDEGELAILDVLENQLELLPQEINSTVSLTCVCHRTGWNSCLME